MSNRGWRGTLVAAAVLVFGLMSPLVWAGLPNDPGDQTVIATPALIREIQFMLLSLGVDPGPLDGNSKQLTDRAVRAFQEASGLPINDINNNAPVSTIFIDRLRKAAAQVLLKGSTPLPNAGETARVAPAPTAAASLPAPPRAEAPAPDRFASCPYNPDDFRIGSKQYTSQSFLDEGFDGVTARAVANMRQRLEEARQIAEKIGGPALVEVQRQAHVLAYFECRQKIEQAATKSN
jgi:peptidoglycan hydrolase-like protein with peptidoglycan-binding domain